MKITLQNAVKTSVIAIALAFSGVSHAADVYNQNAIGGSLVVDTGAKLFGDAMAGESVVQAGGVYQMTSDSDFSKQFFAYCIAPTIEAIQGATYTAHYNTSVNDSIKALFETSYANSLGSDRKQLSFQLALWELNNDDGDLFKVGGEQYFTRNHDSQVEEAQAMLDAISGYRLKNLYTYTTFTGVDGDSNISQPMLAASAVLAVPETETWAMLAAGLGLVGVMGRRRRNEELVNDEKFTG
ncbi:MAG: PEP-CTERM sorting domain-containing protein [Duganella sp.]